MDVHELDRPYAHGDDALATAFRAALGDGPDVDVETSLAGIRRRAARAHRTRLAGAGAVVALAVAAAVVAPSLGVHERATTLSPAVPAPGHADPSASPTPQPSASAPVAFAVLTTGNLLRARDVTAFGGRAMLVGDAETTAGPQAVGGACIDQVLPVANPALAATASWIPANAQHAAPAGGIAPPEVVETVWRWDEGGDNPTSVLQVIAGEVAQCAAGHGQEGHGSVSRHDASALAPSGGQALVLTSPFGDAIEAQVVLAQGPTLVRLQATLATSSAAEAVTALTPTVRAAAERAFGTAIGGDGS